MSTTRNSQEARLRRKQRVRARVSGTAERPRLTVFRSLKHIYAQVIDDVAGKTVVAVRDTEIDAKAKGEGNAKVSLAKAVGSLVAEKAKKAGVSAVVFDRNGYIYSGRVAALAEGAREAGLQF